MKILYLVRHSKSSWKDSAIPDFDRPLSKRGINDAPLIGKVLAHKNIKVDLIISSPAKRTRQTAEIIAEKIKYKKDVKFDKDLYEADVFEIIAIIKEVDESIDDLMIVGHNPGLTDVLNYVTNSNIDNIPTCGVAKLEFNNRWKDIKEHSTKLTDFIYPKMFK
jgi:phosphohistidine phosphatase